MTYLTEFPYLSPTESTTVCVHVTCVMSGVPSPPCTTDSRLSGSRAGNYSVLFVCLQTGSVKLLEFFASFGKLSHYLNYSYFIFYLSRFLAKLLFPSFVPLTPSSLFFFLFLPLLLFLLPYYLLSSALTRTYLSASMRLFP